VVAAPQREPHPHHRAIAVGHQLADELVEHEPVLLECMRARELPAGELHVRRDRECVVEARDGVFEEAGFEQHPADALVRFGEVGQAGDRGAARSERITFSAISSSSSRSWARYTAPMPPAPRSWSRW
jgi:hypothetical protein